MLTNTILVSGAVVQASNRFCLPPYLALLLSDFVELFRENGEGESVAGKPEG